MNCVSERLQKVLFEFRALLLFFTPFFHETARRCWTEVLGRMRGDFRAPLRLMGPLIECEQGPSCLSCGCLFQSAALCFYSFPLNALSALFSLCVSFRCGSPASCLPPGDAPSPHTCSQADVWSCRQVRELQPAAALPQAAACCFTCAHLFFFRLKVFIL